MGETAYTLLDNFTLNGVWWLPENPDARLCGELSFVNDERIILKLLGLTHEATEANKKYEPTIIHGITANGLICTLSANIETEVKLNMPGIPSSTIKCQYLFLGKHFNKPEDIKFSSMQLRFTNLETWLETRPFSSKKPESPSGIGWELTYKQPEKYSARIPCLNSLLEILHGFSIDENLTPENKGYLKITPFEPQNFTWYWEVIFDLCNFLTLLIGEKTYITYVQAFGDDVEVALGRTTKEAIGVYFTQKKYGINKGIWAFEMVMTFPSIAEQMESIIGQWFSKSKHLRSVYDLYFGTSAVRLLES